jgi:pimeloyl-ACP methyl ester carboxylesterase
MIRQGGCKQWQPSLNQLSEQPCRGKSPYDLHQPPGGFNRIVVLGVMDTYEGAKLHMERWLITVGLAIAVLVAVVVAAGYLATMQVVGHLAPAFKSVPADYGLNAEVVSFQSLDGIDLKGWWIPAQGTARATVILAHGNGGNRSSMLSRAGFLAANGYNAFPIDLRAHGESSGNYMTPGYLEALDILGAVEAAKRRGQAGPFVAFGYSYGARASLWAGARSNDIAAVIADAAPRSFRSMPP